MCGITGIIAKKQDSISTSGLVKIMNGAIAHRGPDGEGFIHASAENVVAERGTNAPFESDPGIPYLNFETNLPSNPFLSFGHRRLAIIDLSRLGHQPMCSADAKLWITYNGELYNYLELKQELVSKGHTFISQSDTEVILYAYREWGSACVNRFNGMWAFCIYDSEKKQCFVSRDRFGVKPLYFIHHDAYFAFASEQKAFVKAGLVKASISEKQLHSYLINGLTEFESANFFEGVSELWPGENLVLDLSTFEITRNTYYHLSEHNHLMNDGLTEKELVEHIEATLERAVRLRLRSDVEVGTCLSGGIDSSVLAVLMAAITGRAVHCFTSVFRQETFSEESYATQVAQSISGKHYLVEPTLQGFLKECDQLIYSQDVPIWDTSTYAQYKVMELAHQHQIKVVLDGQGADELFAGYHHHFVAKWNNLAHTKGMASMFRDIQSSDKTIASPLIFYAKEKLKSRLNLSASRFKSLYRDSFIHAYPVLNQSRYFNSVNEQLLHDIYQSRLKTFLKCEDRCGMWHSVESRTPFSDDLPLIELMFSFNGNKKIKNGVSKFLLREAAKSKLPDSIYKRYDKIGFETPMQSWLTSIRPQLLAEIKEQEFPFINPSALDKSDPSDTFQNRALFKLFVLGRWHRVFS